MIQVLDVKKSFGDSVVLDGISLNVEKGELLALVGGSGSGKSVLLKHIAGLMRPDSGSIFINGRDITVLSGRELEAVRGRFGFVFQGGALFDSLTVFENVAFPLREKTKLPKEVIEKKVTKYLELVGLTGSEHKYPSQISGGMAKRTALARSLITDPEILLFDEPTTGLDPAMGISILNLISRVHKNLGFTGVIVTHAIPSVFIATERVAMIHKGRICFDGNARDFLDSDLEIIKEYLGKDPHI